LHVAGLGHVEIAVVHGLREDHRHKAVFIGNLPRVTRLQWGHSGKKAALFVHKTENVGDIARQKLGIEVLLQRFVLGGADSGAIGPLIPV
jgi:hypothetical protein